MGAAGGLTQGQGEGAEVFNAVAAPKAPAAAATTAVAAADDVFFVGAAIC